MPRARKWKRRSQVIQLDLPRPLKLNPFSPNDTTPQGEQQVLTEALTIMYYDESVNPVLASQGKAVRLPEYSDDQLEYARDLVAKEIEAKGGMPAAADLEQALAAAGDDKATYIPSTKRFCLWSEATAAQKLEATKAQFKLLRGQLTEEANRAKGLEKKVSILLGGYGMRSKKQSEAMLITAQAIAEADTNLSCFELLQKREADAIPKRLAYSKGQTEIVETRARSLQAEYGKLCADLRELEQKQQASN